MIDPKNKKKLGDEEEEELNPDAIDAALDDESEDDLETDEDDEVPLVGLDDEEETW